MVNDKKINKEIEDYYSSGVEENRLSVDIFQLEQVRTKEIISRYLSQIPLKILDVGGGTGVYSFWLRDQGHEVHLIDPVPFNVEIAKEHSLSTGKILSSLSLGEAHNLEFDDDYFDLVLFLGPLYHITERSERINALKEAKRVMRKNGIILCAAISRFASMIDGFCRNLIKDPRFVMIMDHDLRYGQHRNTTDEKEYFTTAFFHHPYELKEEIKEACLALQKIIAVESFGSMLSDFNERWQIKEFQELLLDTIRRIEEDSTLLGLSNHLLAVARK